MSGTKWERRLYDFISRTSTQNASSSGICDHDAKLGILKETSQGKKKTYVKQQRADDKLQALTVSDLWIVQAVCLDDIEEVFLSQSPAVLEILEVRKGTIQVAHYRLFVRRRLFEQL
jgi:hypothetical protein